MASVKKKWKGNTIGYTHYWRLKSSGNEDNYQIALENIRHLLSISPYQLGVSLANGQGDEESAPELKPGVRFNGSGDEDSHETFWLPETLKEAKEFDFCKTARKPYDKVVTACLAVLAMHCGDDVWVSSDGDTHEWNPGVELARRILNKPVTHPFEPNSIAIMKDLSEDREAE